MSKLTDLISKEIKPVIESRDDQLVDIKYVTEKSQNYLRVYVDRKPNGIDIAEIAELSELVGAKLDSIVPDPLPDPYILEISSPGVERPIKTDEELENAINQYIHVALYQKVNGEKIYEGTLVKLDQDELTLKVKIKTQRKEITIPKKIISSMRYAIEF
ncbi:MAG: ribosome maturation factor RimP [Lactobacillus sp.]|nr:ribosome maturation factor RimP [Lactobacillus sp.]